MPDVTQNINYHYKDNLPITTRRHNEFGRSLNRISDRSKGLSHGMRGLALRFVGYQLILSQVMSLQQRFISFIGESVTAFREFQTRLAEVSTILGNEQLPLMAALGVGVEELSKKYGQATSDMAKGLYDILSAAFDAENALSLLHTATKASIAGLSDIRTSVQIFTTVLNTYGMIVEQSTRVSNLLFQAVRRGKFEFVELESALGYIVPIAAQAGIQFDELTAALSTATRHGLHLDMTARGLALGIQNIINPSEQAKAAAEKYGVEMNGLSLRVLGLYGWFEQLNEATKEYGKTILGELIPNMRSLRVAMVLAGDVGLAGFHEDLQKIVIMGDATEVAMNKIMKTSQFVANQLTQEFEQVKRKVGADWDELVLNIQRGIIFIAKAFTGGLKEKPKAQSLLGLFPVSGDTIEDAKTWLEVQAQIGYQSEMNTKLKDQLAAAEDELGKNTFRTTQAQRDMIDYMHIMRNVVDKSNQSLADLTTRSGELEDAWFEFRGGLQDSIDTLGNLDLTLDQITLSIEQFEDRLTKTFKYGFKDAKKEMKEAAIEISKLTTLTQEQRNVLGGLGDTIKGNLAYEYLALKASREYADATHDVSMGLKIADYFYKEIPDDIAAAVNEVREYTKAQENSRKATERMTAAMRKYQIQLLELQLKGMMRRRGLTRNEEKQMKAIQIKQAKARLENMKGQKKVLEADVSNYQDSKKIIDGYLLTKQEEQYELKYTYDQQVIDLETLIFREGRSLQTRYEWWETTNDRIIESTTTMLDDLAFLWDKPVFVSLLEDAGVTISDFEADIKSLQETAAGRAGTYPTPSAPTPSAPTWTPPEPGSRSYEPVWHPEDIRGHKRGTWSVPETGPAMLHKYERVIPAGVSSKGGGQEINIGTLVIDVKEIADIGTVEKIMALLSSAKNAKLLTDGKSNMRMR